MSIQRLFPTPLRKTLITASVMGTTLVVALDATIAVVAIPHMQASLNASPEQVTWVLTSYLIASAIMMPLASWLASKFGRKRVMSISVIAFTVASMACGLARSLEFMVFARLAQGAAGAGLIPLGQATLLDINPPEKQPSAMAVAGLGAMLGPLLGPTIGGWLTDNYSWRWVFLINLPIGIAAIFGTLFSHIEVKDKELAKFDMFGFLALTSFIGSFQLMMDRGQHNDWFDSAETFFEAGLLALSFYLLLVHMLTRRDTFVRAALFADRNFALGTIISTVIGIVIFASSPILTLMTQNLLGYSPFKNGLVSLPRGVGTIMSLLVVTRFIRKVDPRMLLCIGLGFSVLSLWMFSQLSLETNETPIMLAGLFQGFSGGLLISPLSALAFSTLSPRFRNEGAAIFALSRNIGNSLGISAIQVMSIRASAQVASRLNEGVRPDNPVFQIARPDFDFTSPAAMARASGEIWRQATMVSTIDTFWLGCMVAIATLPIILLMKGTRLGQTEASPPMDAGH